MIPSGRAAKNSRSACSMVVAAMPILYDGRSAGRRGRARPVDLGPPIAAVAGDGAPSRQIGAVERHGGGGNALALLEAGEHVARGAATQLQPRLVNPPSRPTRL